MKLINLSTKGFKRLRDHHFDFTSGLNVIVGENAAGKSTLLQAIECALFGPSVVPGKVDDLITWGQKTWKVGLTFEINGDTYTLIRSKSSTKLLKGEDLAATGNTPTTKAVEELLGLTAKDYNLFMQSLQGATAGVLTYGAAALNRKVEEFSGIDLIDDVITMASKEHTEAKTRAEALRPEADDISATDALLDEATTDLKEAGYHVEAAQQQFEAVNAEVIPKEPQSDPQQLQQQMSKVERRATRLEQAEKEMASAQERYQETLQRFEELEHPGDVDQLKADLKAAREDLNTKKSRATDLQREMDRQIGIYEEWDDLRHDQDDFSDEALSKLRLKIDASAGSHSSIEQDIDVIKRDQAVITSKIESLDRLKKDAVCPTCNTLLSDHDPEKLQAEIAEQEQALKDLGKVKNKLDQDLREEADRWDQLNKTSTYLTSQRSVFEAHAKDLTDAGVDLEKGETPVEAQLETANEEVAVVTGVVHRLEDQITGHEKLMTKYTTAKNAVKRAGDAMEDARVGASVALNDLKTAQAQGMPTQADIDELTKLWEEYRRLNHEHDIRLREASSGLEAAKQAFKHAEDAKNRFKADLDKLMERQAQSDEAARLADVSGRLTRFLRERRAGYLQEIWDAVLGPASRHVRLATRDQITAVDFRDGVFSFEENGVLAPITSASGAQKAYIGTAVRVGLSRALYGRDSLLIFDEPTESMSESNATGLSASLVGLASQCLLITHRTQDQDLAANIIEVE